MPPLHLSDTELSILMDAARPIPPAARDGFLHAVSAALAQHPGEIGPGIVYRVTRDVQRKFFDPPNLSTSHSKHTRAG